MHARKKGAVSFEKLSREEKIKRKVGVWRRKKERKKYRKVKKEKKNMKEKEEEEKRGGSNKDMRGMNQVKEKKI
jgi:hypothetical protein